MSKARKVSRIFEGELKSDELTLADGSGSVQSQKDANVELAQMIQDISDGSGNHDHDGDYSPVGHSHDDKSDKGHDHDGDYAKNVHGHSDLAGRDHTHGDYKTVADSDAADAALQKSIDDHKSSGHEFLPLSGGSMKSGAKISFPSGSGTIDGLNVATSDTSPVRLKEFEEYKQNAGGSYDDQWVKDALSKEEQERKKADSDLDAAKADTGHTHPTPPLPDHDHPHDHDGKYSPKTHGHSDYSNVNHGHSEYKLKAEADGEHQTLRTDLTAEADNRKKGDDALQAQIDNIQHTPPYDDTQIRSDLSAETSSREAADQVLQDQIDVIESAGYDDTQIKADLAQETADRKAGDDALQAQIDDLPAGTIVSDTAPVDPDEGATWYDTVRLELFVFAEDAWLPCSPLGARVEAGEIVQAQILSRVEAGEVQQQTLSDTKLGKAEANEVTNGFRVKGAGGTYISASGGELGLYHVKYPEDQTHAANLKYVDDETAKTKQYVDDEIAKVKQAGGGPTSRYDGNRFNVSGTSTQQLSSGDVMFLRDAATVTNLGIVNFIGLPEQEFDWDSCAKSGVVKVKNGAQIAGYFQVYDITRNEGRNVLLHVALIVMGQGYEVDYESGTPCYFQGVFFA